MSTFDLPDSFKRNENDPPVMVDNLINDYNKVTVVSDESMEGIEAHIQDMNIQSYKLVSSIGRGNHVMLFWERMK